MIISFTCRYWTWITKYLIYPKIFDFFKIEINLGILTYNQVAHPELIAFHDKNFRSNLEHHLQKHITHRK